MKVAVIGLGQRGLGYIRIINHYHKDVEITAICDKYAARVDEVALKYDIKTKFYKDEDFFKAGKLADAIIIATQDRDHYVHGLKAIELGYNILMEKPVSPIISQCLELEQKAKGKGISIVVCHVLRYSNYYSKIKELIDSGIIGKIQNINHTENIGYFHFAHSYVRGNWHRSDVTSPSLLAKCCHDFDLIYWFMNSECERVSSFGDLSYFNLKNKPEGATLRCIEDCKVKATCPYTAEKLYITDPIYRCTFLKFNGRVITGKAGSTKEDKYKALKETDYGKCVYQCDNNVVDHQIINMQFANGATATHTMTAFSQKFLRRTYIGGTLGEIFGNDLDGKLYVKVFGQKTKVVKTKIIPITGHIEGDIKLIHSWIALLKGDLKDVKDVTFISTTINSHKIVMSAERSRLNNGEVVKVAEYKD
jgi:hypothetical protein